MGETFPRRFGRYTLIEHLAQGGMGSLYLAYQGEAGFEKLCVVKTVLRELADKEYVARFRDEAKVVVRLTHGNLVPVFDAGTVDGELYIAMEYVDGRDLRAVWNRCADKLMPFPVDVAVYIIKELCRGLHHAHTLPDLHLVHRDVSPPNVLLAYSGEVKLTDFGLANSALKLQYTMPGIIYGKVSYMSPEQARGESLDGRADVYAAGVILWELLTGRQLFPNTDGAAIERVRSPEVSRPSMKASRVPLALDALVMKALAPDATLRYPDAESLRAALAGYLAKEAPTIDTARVATFLKQLFEDEIERDRKHREQLIAESRQKLARVTLEPQMSRVAPPPPSVSGPSRVAPQPVLLSPSMRSQVDNDKHARGERTDDQSFGDRGDGGDSGDSGDRSAGLINTIIDGRYRVDRLIGEGGMGRVYEAEHIEIGKRVAVKVLHPTWSRFPELVARFRREARAASRIGHPNIIDVTDSGTTPSGAVYIVMEFLEGADLAEVIAREKALAVDRAMHISVQLARALEAAHEAGVIHRDLKPENVFLIGRPGQADFVKVLDFGIARNLEGETGKPRLTQPNMAMGTPQYMAPEQAAGRPADARSDVYGVGAIVYEMLVGHPPHQGKSPEEILHRKLSEVPVPISELRQDVATALSDCVSTALARDPAMRQQKMSELAEELERYRPDRRRSLRPSAPQRTQGRGWVPAVSVAAASMAFLAAAGTVWWKVSQPVPVVVAPAPAVSPAAGDVAGGPGAAGRAVAPRRDRAPERVERPPAVVEHVERKDTPRVEPRPAVAPPRPNPSARPSTPPRPTVSAADGKRALDEATRLLRDHQFAQAERAFQKLLDSGVERGPAATGLARAAFEAGHYADAVKRGERAVQLGGGAPAHRILGDAYCRVQRYSDAVKHYRAVLKLKPDDRDTRRHLESALAQAGG